MPENIQTIFYTKLYKINKMDQVPSVPLLLPITIRYDRSIHGKLGWCIAPGVASTSFYIYLILFEEGGVLQALAPLSSARLHHLKCHLEFGYGGCWRLCRSCGWAYIWHPLGGLNLRASPHKSETLLGDGVVPAVQDGYLTWVLDGRYHRGRTAIAKVCRFMIIRTDYYLLP